MNTTSPLQLNTASGVNQRPNNTGNGNGGNDGSQFSALLSGELERSTLASMPAPAPAPAAKQDAPKAAEKEKPAQPDDAASQQVARPADSKTDAADAKDDAAAKADDDKTDDDSTAKAGDPASAMLALMASLHKPGADAGKTTVAQAFDTLSGKGKRTDAGQLAALQAAMKSVSKEAGLDAAGAKTFSATSVKNPALAAAGADLGADKAAAASTDLRAALGNVKAEVAPQLDAAEFSLQQARDAALLAQKEQAPTAAVATAQLQPAVLEAAQAAAASEELSAHVGTDAWNDQVGQKVIYMVGAEDQTASLTLNPPDLGPLQVVLSVSNGQADVTFSSNQLEVRQALENALPRLQEMMSESGIALGNATVNAGMSNGGQAQQDQAAASSGFGRGNQGRGNGGNGDNGTVGEATVRPATRTARIGDRGMVDTFA
ncbi:flagellar hook-length control protein FliK [Massilia sp. PDC64]|nr:flagellar hook-length control protein FliK [Massilia sp. PDC64]SDC20059.1 flagellar hook-length control protein FliK [Massilia sp. PDC64]